ncbi:MAG: hypothetical protein SFX18_20255 [Pirellulales bacterium]|nr:hypothetical protein [Pirellulales bacterium]
MSQLAQLRRQLESLSQKRQAIRWGTGWSGFVLAILGILFVFFWLDYSLRLTVLQRVVAWGVAIIASVWAYRKYLAPHLRRAETTQEMALFVERQHQIDSDLIAALQFEDAPAKDWGSTHLQHAVVDYVADFAKGLNIFAGLDRREFVRRAGWLAAVVVILGGLVFLYHGHAWAFLQRLAFVRAYYPTATQIVGWQVGTTTVDPLVPEAAKIRSPYAQPLVVRVTAAGELPPGGKIVLRTPTATRDVELVPSAATASSSGHSTSKTAETNDAIESQAKNSASGKTYEAIIPQLLEDVQCEISLGDAQTDPALVGVIPLPSLELQLAVTAPEYVRQAGGQPPIDPGVRQIAVVEGSSVAINLACTNKKLRSATLTLLETPTKSNGANAGTDSPTTNSPTTNSAANSSSPIVNGLTASAPAAEAAAKPAPSERKVSLTPLNEEKTKWVYRPAAGDALAEIHDVVRFKIDVLDEDELSSSGELEGLIRIKPDRPPTVAMSAVAQHWLATAKPQLDYRATDDYGLGKIRLRVEILRTAQQPVAAAASRFGASIGGFNRRPDSTSSNSDSQGEPDNDITAAIAASPTLSAPETANSNSTSAADPGASQSSDPALNPQPLEVALFTPPLTRESLPLARAFELDLTPYQLNVGDQVKLVMEAIDDRGTLPGKVAASDPLYLQITDESGVFAASAEYDERAARLLDTILKVQTGGNP